jgi:hypothetical protein
MSSDKKQNKYGKKTSFSREKHHVYSEADIDRVDSKQNQWNEKRKEERTHNLKVASGLNEVDEKKEKKEKKEKNPGNYADDIIECEDDDIEYNPKMTLVMHGVPLSYNIDNIMRTFQYYGDVKSLTTTTNIDSTYTITVVPNEWNENVAIIQREIANNGYVMVADYKVSKE